MAVASALTVVNNFSGEIVSSMSLAAAPNTNSPGSITVLTLASGANTITLPTGGTVVARATIHPPSGNTNLLTLKGVSGDTGIILHKTDPSVITFDTTAAATFVIAAAGTTAGVRIIWG